MGQILGQNQNIELLIGIGVHKTLVCLRNSSVNSELPTTQEETNCGTLTSVGTAAVTIDFDAVCETTPTLNQVSYSDLLACLHNGEIINARVDSAAYTHQFDCYVTSLSLAQEAGAYISFSGTLTSNGPITIA